MQATYPEEAGHSRRLCLRAATFQAAHPSLPLVACLWASAASTHLCGV